MSELTKFATDKIFKKKNQENSLCNKSNYLY